MKPVTFAGEGFSEYFCTQLLGTDPQLRPRLDVDGAEASYKKSAAAIRTAQRQLRDRSPSRQPSRPASGCNSSPAVERACSRSRRARWAERTAADAFL